MSYNKAQMISSLTIFLKNNDNDLPLAFAFDYFFEVVVVESEIVACDKFTAKKTR